MNLIEKLDHVSTLVHRLKQDWVETEPENPDLGIYLHFFRGDEVAVGLQCPLDRDSALAAGEIGAMGFNATTMAISFESYHSTLSTSPLTGKPWKHHEMQEVSENHPEAIEKEWVWPCITTSIHDRDGSFALRSEPYLIQGRQLTWLEDKVLTLNSETEGDAGGGVMFDALQEAMTRPTLEQKMEEAAEQDPVAQFLVENATDAEHRLFHADMATLRALAERDLVLAAVFSAAPGTSREKWLAERMGTSLN